MCRFRQSHAPELFLAAYESPHTIIGYVCSTLSASPVLTHESMSTHVPDAKSVCIHSVCVAARYRRRGLGVRMLAEYVKRLESKGLYERILLISHEELRTFYEKAGFKWIGESQVQHGARPWFEMRRILAPPAAPAHLAEPTPLPGLFEALHQRPSANKRHDRALSTFPGGIQDVVVTNSPNSPPTNKHDLICPRPNCGSIILKAGVATLVECPSVQVRSFFPNRSLETSMIN
jgi:GNAT superfamily N-acetyltransferase